MENASNARFVYITAGNVDEALGIGKALVEARLAACANVFEGMRSVFRWVNQVQTEQEAVLVLKTRVDLINAVTNKVKELHSYDCPCVVAFPITGGNQEFLDWIDTETQ